MAHASGHSGPEVIQHAPTWTAHAAKVSTVPSSESQHVTVVLRMRHQRAAEHLATAVSDPDSAQYRHYLSAPQWRSRFAPTQSQVAKVTAWLKSKGLHIGAIPANHRYVQASGTTKQMNSVFDTTLSVFHKSGKRVSAPANALTAPDSVAPLIVEVDGLDSSARMTPLHIGGPDKRAQANATTASAKPSQKLPPPPLVFRNAKPCSAYYGQKKADVPQILADPITYAPCGYVPSQLRGAYGIDSALSQGYDGRGATVAVVDAYASKWIEKDTKKYFRRNDPSHPFRSYQFSQSLPASYSHINECGASGWYGEETLDVQAVHAMAPSANILYVGAASCYDADLAAAENSIIDNQLAMVVTNSWGSAGEVSEPFWHQTFLQAAAQGISILFSSGDSGDEIAATGTRTVDSPVNDPFVTGVGGTALAVGPQNNYMFEQGWGTGKSTLTNGAWDPIPPAYLYGAGGGTSKVFKQPAYQRGVVPNSISKYFGHGKHRAVPDVAMLADPNTGFLIGQSQTMPNGKIRYSEYRLGGTSLASPLFAGVTAVADQVNGGSLGFLNPKLYSEAGTSAFRDIDHGRAVTDGVARVDFVNGVNKRDGLVTSLRTLGQTGTIFTRPGYDDVTGVGSPNGISFLNAMAGGSQSGHAGHGHGAAG
jgi:subtilase family serine protease